MKLAEILIMKDVLLCVENPTKADDLVGKRPWCGGLYIFFSNNPDSPQFQRVRFQT
ncbi:hypothetical protein [Cricetibacter osteomyelitidis]|uniref:hypothetical protein n=1 Tax=Cricetibacter osteomyelitidis TaxID=1521931 RepID=UPI001405388A|nr:hypothetical protein [Cricetibacter osteomyelitidis]